jgi:hypothetical protein
VAKPASLCPAVPEYPLPSSAALILEDRMIITYWQQIKTFSFQLSQINIINIGQFLVYYSSKLFNLLHWPLAIRNTLITRMIVGLIGMILDSTSSSTMPTIDRITMTTSSWFHLKRTFQNYYRQPV